MLKRNVFEQPTLREIFQSWALLSKGLALTDIDTLQMNPWGDKISLDFCFYRVSQLANGIFLVFLPSTNNNASSSISNNTRELKHATFLSHGRAPEVYCFPIQFICLHTTTFIFLSLFSLVETIRLKIWERPMSWPAKCSLPVAVRGSKTLHA